MLHILTLEAIKHILKIIEHKNEHSLSIKSRSLVMFNRFAGDSKLLHYLIGLVIFNVSTYTRVTKTSLASNTSNTFLKFPILQQRDKEQRGLYSLELVRRCQPRPKLSEYQPQFNSRPHLHATSQGGMRALS